MSKEKRLIDVVRDGDLETIKRLIAEKVDVNEKDKWGSSALMLAAIWGHLDIVRFLVENGANVNDKDEWGRTALMYAALYGYLRIVQFLEDFQNSTVK